MVYKTPIYLDHNATTPLAEEVKEAIISTLEIFGNPSSIHHSGIIARELIDSARQSVAQLLSCNNDEIIFTSSCTESNNLAIFGTVLLHKKGHIISTSIEHPAVMMPLKRLMDEGYEITFLPVDGKGIVDPDEIKKAVRKDTILISVMHANNETGMVQPIKEISKIAKDKGILFHSDGAQSVGKIETKMDDLGVDLFSVAGHKFYGPKGVGALYIRPGTRISPISFGAGHEKGLRPGTENIIGIIGLAKACEIAKRDFDMRYAQNLSLTNLIYHALIEKASIRLNGAMDGRLPNTLNISIKGISSNKFVLDIRDSVAISAGSACHAGVCKPSYVLKAMGLSDEDALSAIRISTGKDNSIEEVKKAIECLYNIIQISYKKKLSLQS